ncbi:hypothetical protein G9A89_021976 [Geosiphon pyriformis]|nr:hypothetical protein G9A89_021976 [Geosiphon pyriformis]
MEKLLSKLVKSLSSGLGLAADCLVSTWLTIDKVKVFKMVLDHLIINNNLIFEPQMVKSLINTIMKDWTKKRLASDALPDHWHKQYVPLDYVNDKVFSKVMSDINMCKLMCIVKNLSDGKAAGLSGISNELWKHGNASVFNGIFTNIHPIALIETAQKILFKVFLDRISLACSRFNVLCDNNFSVLKGVACSLGYAQDLQFCQVGEVFLPLLWRIFYDLLLCEVKKHEHLFDYRMCSKFFTKTEKLNPRNSLISFFAVSAFVDNTIWIGNCLTATQNILNIASEFFVINNISINTDKMVAIPINQVVRKDESHRYLGIFLSTDGLFKPSLTKMYVDVKFFSNVVLRKAITKKQFLYLVSTVLQPIVSYRLQFSFVSKSVCEKWDRLLKKRLKLKVNLPKDFPSKVLHHPEFYGLKTFEQLLTENLLTNLAASWTLQHPLHFPITLSINSLNCFLVGATYALTLCNLFLGGTILNVFQAKSNVFILDMLGLGVFISVKKLDSKGPILVWFVFLSEFVGNDGLGGSLALAFCPICNDMSCDVGFVSKCILASGCSPIEVYTDSSVRDLGIIGVCSGVAAYFFTTNISVGVRVHGLLSSTLVKLQVIALALECVPASSAVTLFMNSQVSLDMCKFGVSVPGPDFHRKCWLKKKHICQSISKKNLLVTWRKVKEHSGVVGNEQADFFANMAVASKSMLSLNVPYHFFSVENWLVLGNVHYFVKGLFDAIYFVNWEFKCAFYIVNKNFACIVNMSRSFNIWHPNGKIRSGYTIAIRKRLYNPKYPNVLCIRYGLVEDLDHSFLCEQDKDTRKDLLLATQVKWCKMVGCLVMEDLVVKFFHKAGSAGGLYMMLAKEFVLKSWVTDAACYFGS